MVKLTIDNMAVEVSEGITILEAAKSAGIEIPHFCYHPCLTVAGNCRMCLVEIEGVKNPVISCKEPVREGMVVHTTSELAKKARKDVLEFVLVNHPLDCPVCDQSGECFLQDYYFEYSLRPSRLRDEKVHKPKAERIGPHVILDAERCVECTRCIRFCEEIAGVHEIGLFERGDHSTIGVLKGKELSNPYSLCAVDLCPVGALTSIDFRFKKRVWYLKSAPSICLGCASGCNVWVDYEGTTIYRLRPRENMRVNRCLMCDWGRMTYKSLLMENRVLSPLVLKDGKMIEAGWTEAILRIKELLNSGNCSETVGVLSAELSVEENETFAKLCRDKFGTSRLVFAGRDSDPSFGDDILRDSDKNPNLSGVQRITKERAGNFKKKSAYLVLGVPGSKDMASIIQSQPAWSVFITSSTPEGIAAQVILPKATYVEQDGTFINRNGIEQRAQKIFNSLPDSQTVEEIYKIFRSW